MWYIDAGMGIFKVFRVFIFSPAKNNFNEIRPTCGDDFINVRLNNSRFINTLFEDNTPKTCSVLQGLLK